MPRKSIFLIGLAIVFIAGLGVVVAKSLPEKDNLKVVLDEMSSMEVRLGARTTIDPSQSSSTSTFTSGITLSSGCFDIGGTCITGGSAGATTALDNLASVAINTSLLSDANNTDDLGAYGTAWRDVYVSSSLFIGGGTGTSTFDNDAVAFSTDLMNADGVSFYNSGDGTGNYERLRMYTASNQYRIHTETSGGTARDIWIGNSGYAAFYSDDNLKRVGIGTTAPAVVLDVAVNDANNSSITDMFELSHRLTGTAATSTGVRMLFQQEVGDGTLKQIAGIAGILTDPDIGDYSSDLVFYTASDAAAIAEGFRITSDGNVIPASNNSGDLGVFGNAWKDVYASGTLRVSGTSDFFDSLTIKRSNNQLNLDTLSTNQAAAFAFSSNGTQRWSFFKTADANNDFAIYANEKNDNVFYIDGTNGFIGISGQDAPTTGLHLGANASGHSLTAWDDIMVSGGLEVDGTSWFDGALIASTSLQIPSANASTLDAAGEIALDRTEDQLVYYSNKVNVLSPTSSIGWNLETPVAGDSTQIFRAPYDITLQVVTCNAQAAATEDYVRMDVITFDADLTTTSSILTGDLDCTATTVSTTAFSDATITKGIGIGFFIESTSGTAATWLPAQIEYLIDRK